MRPPEGEGHGERGILGREVRTEPPGSGAGIGIRSGSGSGPGSGLRGARTPPGSAGMFHGIAGPAGMGGESRGRRGGVPEVPGEGSPGGSWGFPEGPGAPTPSNAATPPSLRSPREQPELYEEVKLYKNGPREGRSTTTWPSCLRW
ncbi:collagen alpha-2(I) chain-like isoform X1 [Chiroxiphia lanceolata]|uniref:collagen alpha-2(I) chain-like isoform X1 n=1 Tax=Chiroxiphia lanceolata TaxID=296741 RepID=UPI0013CEEE3C|nr:collagen alpha-2(I) chain-like isoform X1 [Chiroxiphia lanceolata]